MATATISLAFCIETHRPYRALCFTRSSPAPRHCLLSSHKSHRCGSDSSSVSSSSNLSSPTTVTETRNYSFLRDPFRGGKFLTNDELEKIKTLETFTYFRELESGSLWVRAMRPGEIDSTVKLLAESFGESMLLPRGYEALLRFLVKQYFIERRGALPHAVTLLGFFRSREDENADGDELAGTVEVCFNKLGSNASPPTPIPPRNSPYVCNMTVIKPLRRRGIGWHLLKASEELISLMTSTREVYLHCRMIDTAPFNMYTKAGYEIVKTDNVLVLLKLQRRKHLMCKKLPLLNNPSEQASPGSEDEPSSLSSL